MILKYVDHIDYELKINSDCDDGDIIVPISGKINVFMKDGRAIDLEVSFEQTSQV